MVGTGQRIGEWQRLSRAFCALLTMLCFGVVAGCGGGEARDPYSIRLPELPIAKCPPGSVAVGPVCLPTGGPLVSAAESPAETVALGVSANGRMVGSRRRDGTAVLWDVRTGAKVWTGTALPAARSEFAASPDGLWAASESPNHALELRDESAGTLRHVLAGHDGRVLAATFSPDGTVLASAGADGAVWLWSVHTGRPRQILAGHVGGAVSVAFSCDGQALVTGDGGGGVRLWDARTGHLRSVLARQAGRVTAVALSPDGRWTATGGENVRVWDVQSGELLQTLR